MSKSIEGVLPRIDSLTYSASGDGTMNTFEEWSALLKAYQKAVESRAQAVAYPSFGNRIWPEGREESFEVCRGRP